MSSFEFGLFCLLGFAVPVPILAWLDRVSTGKKRTARLVPVVRAKREKR